MGTLYQDLAWTPHEYSLERDNSLFGIQIFQTEELIDESFDYKLQEINDNGHIIRALDDGHGGGGG